MAFPSLSPSAMAISDPDGSMLDKVWQASVASYPLLAARGSLINAFCLGRFHSRAELRDEDGADQSRDWPGGRGGPTRRTIMGGADDMLLKGAIVSVSCEQL